MAPVEHPEDSAMAPVEHPEETAIVLVEQARDVRYSGLQWSVEQAWVDVRGVGICGTLLEDPASRFLQWKHGALWRGSPFFDEGMLYLSFSHTMRICAPL